MKTGDLVVINQDPSTNNWWRRAAYEHNTYWTYKTRECGEINGEAIYMNEITPTLVPLESYAVVIAVMKEETRRPVIVMINSELYAFGHSELLIIKRI